MQSQTQQVAFQSETPDTLRALLTEARDALTKCPLKAGDILDRAMGLLGTRSPPSSLLPRGVLDPWRVVGVAGVQPASFARQVFRDAADEPPAVPQGRTAPDGVIRFGRYVILPGSRTLLCDGRAVPLGSRAFDLLWVLVSSRGAVIGKKQILESVWPSTVVEESNLRFQMARLRHALGPDRDLIKTVPGRGYLFVLEPPVEQAAEDARAPRPAADGPNLSTLRWSVEAV